MMVRGGETLQESLCLVDAPRSGKGVAFPGSWNAMEVSTCLNPACQAGLVVPTEPSCVEEEEELVKLPSQ